MAAYAVACDAGIVSVEAIETTDEVSVAATAGLAPTRTKGPRALESLVDDVIAKDEWFSEDPGGVNPVTWSAMLSEVWAHTQDTRPEMCWKIFYEHVSGRLPASIAAAAFYLGLGRQSPAPFICQHPFTSLLKDKCTARTRNE